MPNSSFESSSATVPGCPEAWIRPQRILLATDLADLRQTLPVAVDEAKRYKATVLIVHVLPDYTSPPAAPSLLIYSHPEEHRHHAELQLKAAVQMVQEEGIECSSKILVGDAIEAIVAMAAEWQPDRVIAGSHGTEKYCLRILGSVSEQLFRTLDVPVIAVGPKVVRRTSRKPRHRRILVPVTFKKDTAAVVRFASAYAHGHDVDTILLHVIPGLYGQASSALRASRCRAEMIKRFGGVHQGETAPTCVVKNGEPTETILQCATECGIDLIVLGTVAATAFRPKLVPGTAYGVLSNAPCPILILRQSQFASDADQGHEDDGHFDDKLEEAAAATAGHAMSH